MSTQLRINVNDPYHVLKHSELLMRQDADLTARVCQALLHSRSLHAAPDRDVLFVRLAACQAMAELGSRQLSKDTLERALQVLEHGLQVASLQPFPAQQARVKGHYDAPTATRLLYETITALAQGQVVALPFGGVLLGLIREGALLPGDKDLDLVIPVGHFQRALELVQVLGWRPAWVALNTTNFRVFQHPQSGITLDLFAYDFDGPQGQVIGGWWPSGMPREAGRIFVFRPFGWCAAEHEGHSCWQVDAPEQILGQIYGEHWRIPDPDYDTTLESPALQAFNTYTRCWCYLRLLEAWSNGRQDLLARRLRVLARLDERAAPLKWFHGMLKS